MSKIKLVVSEPFKNIEVREVEHRDYRAMRDIIGNTMDVIRHLPELNGVDIYVDGEYLMKSYPEVTKTMKIYCTEVGFRYNSGYNLDLSEPLGQPVLGPAFFSRINPANGEAVDLTDEDIETITKFCDKYKMTLAKLEEQVKEQVISEVKNG